MRQQPLLDTFGRVATDLRVSLTDRCNLRCTYCMPAEGLEWMPHSEALTDEERDQVRKDMGGRDNEDELSLRADAALCRRVVGPDGQDFPDRMTWEDFRDLRERIGVQVYESTISAAASQASGAVGGHRCRGS